MARMEARPRWWRSDSFNFGGLFIQLEPADSINPETNIVFPQCVEFLVQKVEWIWKFAEKTMNPLSRLLLLTMLLVGKLQKRCFFIVFNCKG